MDFIKNIWEVIHPIISSSASLTIVKVMLILTAVAGMYLVLKQEAKVNGLSGVSGAATANNNSYWNKNKGRSVEGKRIRWTRFLFILFLFEALFLYAVS